MKLSLRTSKNDVILIGEGERKCYLGWFLSIEGVTREENWCNSDEVIYGQPILYAYYFSNLIATLPSNVASWMCGTLNVI